jgi:hypothetical protein
MTNAPVTMDQLQSIASFLENGKHTLAHKAAPHFPYGVFNLSDGREILFDRNYTPLWERLANGTVQCADPLETPRGNETFFFNDNPPWHQQYEANKQLRRLLVRWRVIDATSRDDRKIRREDFVRRRLERQRRKNIQEWAKEHDD